MAWKGKDKTPGKFSDLLKPLMNANIQQSNNPLFQVLSQIIQRSNDEGVVVNQTIKETVGAISSIGDTVIIIRGNIDNFGTRAFLLAEPVPVDPSINTLVLPNARELLAGTGVTFNDTVPNERTIDVTAGTGDVVGPAVAVDGDIVLFDGTTGKLIKDSGLLLTDLTDVTVLTENNETTIFANSRQLLAGTNVTFDDTTPGERTIDVTGVGTGDVVGTPPSTDNGIVRYDGTTGLLIQDTSGPILEDDGSISNLTDPTNAQDAATKAYVDGVATGFPNATYLTENDETADLPNSRQLLAGTNITFDDTVAGQRTIDASGSGGSWGNDFTDPTSPTFAWINQGSATITNGTIWGRNSTFLYGPANASTSLKIRKKAVPTAPYVLTAAFMPLMLPINYHRLGICLRDSATGKLVTFGPAHNNVLGLSNLALMKFTNETTFASTYLNEAWFTFGPLIYLRITDNNTDRICSWSADGQNFMVYHTVGRTDFITPDEIGFWVDCSNASYDIGLTLLSWLEA